MSLTFVATENEDNHGSVLELVNTEEKHIGWIIRYHDGYMGVLGGFKGYPHHWPNPSETIEDARAAVTKFYEENEEIHLLTRDNVIVMEQSDEEETSEAA